MFLKAVKKITWLCVDFGSYNEVDREILYEVLMQKMILMS